MTQGRGCFGPRNAAILAAAAIGLGFFLRVERRAAAPLLRLEMLRQTSLSASLALGFLVAALASLPAGRLVDRYGAPPMVLMGLGGMAAGCLLLALRPTSSLAGYLAPLACLTASYALFQTGNNTAVMADLQPDRRGLVSGLLNLARNLGLITGTAVLGALFALASGAADLRSARSEDVSAGLRVTFGAAALLVLRALGIAALGRALARRDAREDGHGRS